MIARTITIQNRLGLHARAASKLVETTQGYSAKVEIANGEQRANGKSIMSVLMLQASLGTELEVCVNGEDEAEALDSIIALINDLFGEDE